MAVEQAVEGPSWTGFGIHESAGRYPLRVEGAVSSVVGRLLPGVITTTRHARMYSLHTLAWAEAHERDLDHSAADDLLRRCEVVAAAIHHLHETHRIALSTAHGEGEVESFLSDDMFDVSAAAEPGGLSRNGFAGVYFAPCIDVGALSNEAYPHPGLRADVRRVRQGLGDLLCLADEPRLAVEELRSAGDSLCLCEAAVHEDGSWLREVLVEDAEDNIEDRYRQRTCGLLLDALHESPDSWPTGAFRRRWGFGFAEGNPDDGERDLVAALWRAAVLRNFSVGAWRGLWRWLAEQLSGEPMTAQELGDRLADALEDVSVRALLSDLPARAEGQFLLPAEIELESLERTPMRFIQELALGSERLRDLDGATLKAFVGVDPSDLGPRWVQGLLEENHERHIRDVARELAVILVRRAQRVALSKMRLTRDGKPFVPTRLRDRDGILSVRGEEGAGDVALRIESLADILAGLGYLELDDDRRYVVSDMGEELRGRLA